MCVCVCVCVCVCICIYIKHFNIFSVRLRDMLTLYNACLIKGW